MLIGIYTLRLNKKREVRLPEKIVAGLCSGSGPRQVCFAVAEHMRCYSLEGARAYMSALQGLNTTQARELVRLVAAHGVADVSQGGVLRIPEAFCTMYHFTRTREITLLGCGDYVELRHVAPQGGIAESRGLL